MSADIEAIRERAMGFAYNEPCCRPTQNDVDALLAEVDKLRVALDDRVSTLMMAGTVLADVEKERDAAAAAIRQHREQVTSWNIVNREPAPADEQLWSVMASLPDDRKTA